MLGASENNFFIVDSLWNKIHGHFKDIYYAIFANIEFDMPKKVYVQYWQIIKKTKVFILSYVKNKVDTVKRNIRNT